MAQHDLDIANGSGSTVRGDLNDALEALGTIQKGGSAPSGAAAGWTWLDDDTPSSSLWTLKRYDGADWVHVAYFDTTNNRWIPAGAYLGMRVFSTPGTTTYTETTGTRAVLVEVQGAGGGSGGCAATTSGQWAAGRPGGAGGFSRRYMTSSFSGVTITVGAGGAGGSAGDNAGSNGGDSSFGSAAVGGGGGGGGGSGSVQTGAGFTPAGTAAAGGTATTGDVNIAGGAAGVPIALSNALVMRAAGGAAMLGPGGAAASVSSNNVAGAAPASGYGGGAAGPVNANGSFSAQAGAAGAQGIVIVHEFG